MERFAGAASPRRRALVEVVRHPRGPRVYLGGWRVHHGAFGAAVCTVGVAAGSLETAAVGLALVAHDASDFPWRDGDNH